MAVKPKKPVSKAKNSKQGTAVFLIVDDEGQRIQIAKELESAGFSVRTYFTAREFLLDAVDKKTGVIITGYRLREMNGVELVEHLAAKRNSLPVVLLTGHADVPKLIKAGISEFIVHPYDLETLQDAIGRAVNGNQFTDNELMEAFKRLTDRELEVVNAICEGHSSREIAADLEISTKTVEAHRARIMDKTRAGDVGDLVRMRMAWKG